MPFFDKYPYTNFHNVNLDWILERVKEWGALVEQNNTAFHDLEEANEDFKNYVTSYLENLDIQAQIDDKLDRMFESGVLGEYLQPYVSPVVTTWLDENITQPTGVVIDSSLTVAGACADAKATGDRIRPLEYTGEDYFKTSLINCLQKMVFVDSTGEQLISDLKSSMGLGVIVNFPENSTLIQGSVVYGENINGIRRAELNTDSNTRAILCSDNRNDNTGNIPFYGKYIFKQGEYNRVFVNAEYPNGTTLEFTASQLFILNGTYFVRRLGARNPINTTITIPVDNTENFIVIGFIANGFIPTNAINSAIVKLTKE